MLNKMLQEEDYFTKTLSSTGRPQTVNDTVPVLQQ